MILLTVHLKTKPDACRKCCSHPQFFTLIRIWHGAKIAEKQVSKIERDIIPQSKKRTDGIIESESARKSIFFQNQKYQIMQYAATKTAPKITQNQNDAELSNPSTVPGTFTTMQIKLPNLPTCSRTSIILFFHFPSKPSGHFAA